MKLSAENIDRNDRFSEHYMATVTVLYLCLSVGRFEDLSCIKNQDQEFKMGFGFSNSRFFNFY
jgi:hypothetical protein